MSQEQSHIEKIRHTASHVLACAVLKLYPDAKLGIGPIIDNGFYYDFELPHPLSDADLPKIEKEMHHIINQNWVMKKEVMERGEAIKTAKNLDQPYKIELIQDLPDDAEISFYSLTKEGTNQSFTDLCAGPHAETAGEIKAFKLTSVAGAYWRGSEKNKMLTRIYGVAFENQTELDQYLKMLEEAKKRDHRKLGPELDLFCFSDLVGSGLPLWTPKGVVLRDLLDNFVWKLRRERGYERVEIPHITKKDLYEKSGHWDKFQNELFKITTREGHVFAMKPMNCPHHTQIFARKSWSWRDLPQRYANTTMVYRDEQSGELNGLSRVRSITQDDAHVFCRPDQVEKEMGAIWDIVQKFYHAVGFKLRVRLSLHDPKQPDQYLGDKDLWKKSEEQLNKLAQSRKVEVETAVGEAAFYGPKIDFMAKDSLGREWQVATIQLDMNMPQRFDLTYTTEAGKSENVVMIHAAIMGSLERYIAILIEHFGGAFPLWLSPVQIIVLPITEKHAKYGKIVQEKLLESGFRVETDNRNETLGKRIRTAEIQKIPVVCVVGDKEQESETVAVRRFGKGDTGAKSLEVLIKELKKEEGRR